MHHNALGNFCRRVRKLRALSQQEIADAAKIDVNTVRNIEAGLDMQLATLGKLAEALRVPLDQLARVAARGRP